MLADSASSAIAAANWGLMSDQYVSGDFDGDGASDFAVWRRGASAGTFVIKTGLTGTIVMRTWGGLNDVPAAQFNVYY